MAAENEISEKTKMPLSWTISLIGALATGGGGLGTSMYRISQLEQSQTKVEAKVEASKDAEHHHYLQLQHIEDSLENIKQSQAEIVEQLTKRDRR